MPRKEGGAVRLGECYIILFTDRALGTGDGLLVVIDLHLKIDGSINVFERHGGYVASHGLYINDNVISAMAIGDEEDASRSSCILAVFKKS
jgi:hypothetical protein